MLPEPNVNANVLLKHFDQFLYMALYKIFAV